MSNNFLLDSLERELPLVNDGNTEAVFKTFTKYVADKESLRKSIITGNFFYEYSFYRKIIEGTIFEDGIQFLMDECHKAFEKNREECVSIMSENIYAISNGLKTWRRSGALSNPSIDIERVDLVAAFYISVIGDLVEGTLQPYIRFFDDVFRFLHNEEPRRNKAKLGVLVDYIIKHNELYEGLFSKMFFDIPIHQWRNIDAHNSYKVLGNDIELTYGANLEKKATLSLRDITCARIALDGLLYMHKIAFMLLLVDYAKHESHDGADKDEICILNDNENIISHIVEATFAFDMDLIDIDEKKHIIKTKFRSKELERDALWEYAYSGILIWGVGTEILVYKEDKVNYSITHCGDRIEMLRYKV